MTTRRRDEQGTNLVEYCFLVGLIALIGIAAIAVFGDGTSAQMSRNAAEVATAG